MLDKTAVDQIYAKGFFDAAAELNIPIEKAAQISPDMIYKLLGGAVGGIGGAYAGAHAGKGKGKNDHSVAGGILGGLGGAGAGVLGGMGAQELVKMLTEYMAKRKEPTSGSASPHYKGTGAGESANTAQEQLENAQNAGLESHSNPGLITKLRAYLAPNASSQVPPTMSPQEQESLDELLRSFNYDPTISPKDQLGDISGLSTRFINRSANEDLRDAHAAAGLPAFPKE